MGYKQLSSTAGVLSALASSTIYFRLHRPPSRRRGCVDVAIKMKLRLAWSYVVCCSFWFINIHGEEFLVGAYGMRCGIMASVNIKYRVFFHFSSRHVSQAVFNVSCHKTVTAAVIVTIVSGLTLVVRWVVDLTLVMVGRLGCGKFLIYANIIATRSWR